MRMGIDMFDNSTIMVKYQVGLAFSRSMVVAHPSGPALEGALFEIGVVI